MEFTKHARLTVMARGIDRIWIERTIDAPDFVGVDPNDPEVRRAFRRIAELGDRWLRVVYRIRDERVIVITAFVDRDAEKYR